MYYSLGLISLKDIKNFRTFNSRLQGHPDKTKLNILVLGGSQAAKIFAEKLPYLFKQCLKQGVSLKIYLNWD